MHISASGKRRRTLTAFITIALITYAAASKIGKVIQCGDTVKILG